MSLAARIAAVLAIALALAAAAWRIHAKADSAGYARAQAAYQAEINRLQTEAAATLATETNRVRLAEQTLQAAKNSQEIKDAKNTQAITALSASLRAAAGPAGRLRDPHATQCGGSSDRPPSDPATTTSVGATDPTQTGWLLSKQLTEFLFEQARKADDINAAYASCRADAYTVRGTTPPH